MLTQKILKPIVIIIALIASANIANLVLNQPSWQITRFINVDIESNFPTWFSSILLFIAAILAYECKQTLFSLFLLFMSCDEVAMIHEHASQVIDKYLIHKNIYNWSTTLGPFVLLVMLTGARSLYKAFKKNPRVLRLFSIGILIYITGAFVIESLISLKPFIQTKMYFKIEPIIEEIFEMIGVTLLLNGLFLQRDTLHHNPE